MKLDELISEVLELDANATKGPWKTNGLSWNSVSGSNNATILTMKSKGNFGSERPIGRLCMYANWSDPVFPDENGNNCWELPMKENADLMIHYRTAAPELARACKRMRMAMHASAPPEYKCSDCSIDQEPCPTCYSAWWKKEHTNIVRAALKDSK